MEGEWYIISKNHDVIINMKDVKKKEKEKKIKQIEDG